MAFLGTLVFECTMPDMNQGITDKLGDKALGLIRYISCLMQAKAANEIAIWARTLEPVQKPNICRS